MIQVIPALVEGMYFHNIIKIHDYPHTNCIWASLVMKLPRLSTQSCKRVLNSHVTLHTPGELQVQALMAVGLSTLPHTDLLQCMASSHMPNIKFALIHTLHTCHYVTIT